MSECYRAPYSSSYYAKLEKKGFVAAPTEKEETSVVYTTAVEFEEGYCLTTFGECEPQEVHPRREERLVVSRPKKPSRNLNARVLVKNWPAVDDKKAIEEHVKKIELREALEERRRNRKLILTPKPAKIIAPRTRAPFQPLTQNADKVDKVPALEVAKEAPANTRAATIKALQRTPLTRSPLGKGLVSCVV